MKMFLLIAGKGFYPKQSTGDWVKTYSTYEEALSKVEDTCKGVKAFCFDRYKINEMYYDWYSIIDLNKWCN